MCMCSSVFAPSFTCSSAITTYFLSLCSLAYPPLGGSAAGLFFFNLSRGIWHRTSYDFPAASTWGNTVRITLSGGEGNSMTQTLGSRFLFLFPSLPFPALLPFLVSR
eukprot:RCo007614